MKNIKSLYQLKTQYYGEVGTPERDGIERELKALRIGFKLRSEENNKDWLKRRLQNESIKNALSYQRLKLMARILR